MIEVFKENFLPMWGPIIFIGIPLLFFIVDRFIKWRLEKDLPILAPRIMKNLILPTFAIYLMCTKLVGLSRDHISVKITETILTIFIITFFFNFINYLFFSKNNVITGKEIIPKLGQDVIHFVMITFITAWTLSSVWGLDLGNLLTALGVSSLVIGLALQEPLGNLFNGIAILLAKPFQKNDWVEIGSDVGKVVEFNWRSVKLHTHYNELIIIPNNALGKEKIKNLSRPSRVHAEIITIGFSYDDKPETVKAILHDIANKIKGVLDTPEPMPLTLSYEDFYIKYGLKFYISDYSDILIIRDQLMTLIHSEALSSGLSIPFPKLDIVSKSVIENVEGLINID